MMSKASSASSLPPAAAAYVTALNNSDVAAEYVTKLKVSAWVWVGVGV